MTVDSVKLSPIYFIHTSTNFTTSIQIIMWVEANPTKILYLSSLSIFQLCWHNNLHTSFCKTHFTHHCGQGNPSQQLMQVFVGQFITSKFPILCQEEQVLLHAMLCTCSLHYKYILNAEMLYMVQMALLCTIIHNGKVATLVCSKYPSLLALH